MKFNKWFIVLALIGVLGIMTACGAKDNVEDNNKQTSGIINKTGFPIVDDKITLKFFAGEAPASPDWNDDFPVWKEYEDMTNIEIDWVEQIIMDNLAEKRNLVLAGGDLPDVFYATTFSNADLLKYGEQGTFIDLKDLIDEYAPNFKRLMDENPAIRKGITFPDGNIYALPNITDSNFLSMSMGAKPWIDETWLDRLGMETPETTEEFYNFLKAVKAENPNTFPFGSSDINLLVRAINGSFGLNAGNVDSDPDSDGLRFIPTSDKYRKMLEYMHKLYDEELIPKNIFSMEWNQFLSDSGEGNYASIIFWNPNNSIGGDAAKNFKSFFPLKGPDGDQLYTFITSPLHQNGQFVITKDNPHPAETIRWIDYFYGDEGSKMMHMGIEGLSFVEEDGKYRYSDEVMKAEGVGRPVDKMKEFAPGIGLHPPAVIKKEFHVGSVSEEDSLEAAERLKPYLPDEIWPAFTYTKEENDFMNSTGNDINKYVNEMRDKFIAGDEALDDKNWESYVKTLESMDLEKYMEIEAAAYERYRNN